MEELNQGYSLIENRRLDILELSTILLILASFFSIVNLRYLKLPMTIGLMILAIALSVIILIFGFFFPAFYDLAYTITESFDFNFMLMNVMLPFLLFAGAMSINVHILRKDKITILLLASFGVLFSTYVVGSLTFYLLNSPLFGLSTLGISYLDCLLFGATPSARRTSRWPSWIASRTRPAVRRAASPSGTSAGPTPACP